MGGRFPGDPQVRSRGSQLTYFGQQEERGLASVLNQEAARFACGFGSAQRFRWFYDQLSDDLGDRDQRPWGSRHGQAARDIKAPANLNTGCCSDRPIRSQSGRSPNQTSEQRHLKTSLFYEGVQVHPIMKEGCDLKSFSRPATHKNL
jgi:hypothetical protein